MLNKIELLKKTDTAEAIIKAIKESKLPVILWGFGGRIPVIWDYLMETGIKIAGICDNDKKKQGKVWDGIEVVSFNIIKQKYDECNIIIVPPIPRIKNEIKQQILEDGQFNNVYSFEMYYPYGSSMKNIMEGHFNEILNAYNILADEMSRVIFENHVSYAITKEPSFLDEQTEPVYFDETVLPITSDEIFCECGVLDGNTTLMLKKLKGFRKAYCFEPDPENFELCKKNLGSEKNIELINKAVWDSIGNISFVSSLGGGSAVNDKGNVLVDTITLDAFFKSKEVSFIKMDIEGAELNALRGGKEILSRKDAPKLAIAAYHKMSDLWEIPLYIKNCNPEYKIFIRKYVDDIGYDRAVYYAFL